MRTTTLTVTLALRADASESRIREAALAELQLMMKGWRRVPFTFTQDEDKKDVYVVSVDEAVYAQLTTTGDIIEALKAENAVNVNRLGERDLETRVAQLSDDDRALCHRLLDLLEQAPPG